jgi:hypothetical protein
MSRLTRRLEEIDQHQRKLGNERALQHHLGEAGDGLEFAARVALGAYAARDRAVDESDVFRLGYATACKELAMVLRHMRAGTQPTPADLRQARADAAEQCGAEYVTRGNRPEDTMGEPPFDHLGWLRGKLTELSAKAKKMALDCDEDHECGSYSADFERLATELEMAVRGEEYT